MTQDEECLSETNSNINTNNEMPPKRFSITMEFPMFVIMLGMSLCGAAISNILLYRTCARALNYPEERCRAFLSLDKNNQTHDIEAEVQKYATIVSTVRSIIEAVVPAVLSCFLGVWSDTHGRKPLVVWPIFGMTMSGVLLVIYSMMDELGPWWYILTVIPYSLTGGFTIFYTGALCYMSDITRPENRSLRITVLEASLLLGSVIGSILSTRVLRLVGNVYLLLIANSFNAIAYVFTNVFLKESLVGAIQGSFTTVLDLSLVKEMMRECFKWRPNHGRAQVLLLIMANCMAIFILYGALGLDYMYTRQKLHWEMKDYTQFSAVSTTISFVGSFVGIGILQKLLKLSDLVIPSIAYVSSAVEYIIRIFATNTWHMYLGAGVSSFKGLASPMIRSFLTKILPVGDIAKVFALMSAIEGLCPLLSPLLYNSLYEVTVATFPGAIYLLSTGIIIMCLICVSFVQFYRRNVDSPYQPLNLES